MLDIGLLAEYTHCTGVPDLFCLLLVHSRVDIEPERNTSRRREAGTVEQLSAKQLCSLYSRLYAPHHAVVFMCLIGWRDRV